MQSENASVLFLGDIQMKNRKKKERKQDIFMGLLFGIVMLFGICMILFSVFRTPMQYEKLCVTSGNVKTVTPLYHEIFPLFQNHPYGYRITLDDGTSYQSFSFATCQTSLKQLKTGEHVVLEYEYGRYNYIYTLQSENEIYFTYDKVAADLKQNNSIGISGGTLWTLLGMLIASLYYLLEWNRRKKKKERHEKRYASYLKKKE